jgi:hypothetical protein
MAKRKAGSQIGSLIPDQKKSRIDPIYLFADGVQQFRLNFTILKVILL